MRLLDGWREWRESPREHDHMEEEMRFHVEQETERNIQHGMAPARARREAQKSFGGVDRFRERARDERPGSAVADVLVDARYALRGMARAPGFTAVALLTIALGIGANAGIFSVVNGVVLRPLPYAEPDRLLRISTQFPGLGFDQFWVSPPEYFELKEQTRTLSSVGAYRTGMASVGAVEAPLRVTSAFTTPDLFTTLGVPARLGRTFLEEEGLPGGESVAILSHGLWQVAFAADPQIIGRAIHVNGIQRQVVGVMAPQFDVADAGVQIWLPYTLDPSNRQNRGSHFLDLVGRMRPGVTLEQARTELARLTALAAEQNTGVHTLQAEQHPLRADPLQDDVLGNARNALFLLLGAVGFVLLIACANVANLLLARAESRQKEIAVRAALGGGRGRLLRQFLTEGVVLSTVGGALGLALGYGGVRALIAVSPDGIPRAAEIGLDGTVLLFTLGVSLLTGVLFGLAPALQLAGRNMTSVLRDATGRTTAGASRLRVRNVLVLAEVALAVVLLVGCALLLRSFAELRSVHPGFEPDGLVTFGLFLPSAGYPDAPSQLAFYDGLISRLERLPGVTGVAAMTGLPPRRDMDANDTDFEGIPMTPEGPNHNIDYYQTATADYVDVMRIRIAEGRGFAHTDVNGPAVALINERTARTFYPDASPIGRRLRPCCGDDNPWFTIIGVTQDVKQGGIEEPAGTEMYVLYPQREHTTWGLPRSMNVVVRTQRDPRAVMGAARAAVAELDPTLPVANLRTMNDVLYASMAGPRFMTLLLSIFAGVALALAAIGTYGVMAYSVAQRRQEFGIRMALGAEQGTVLGMVLRQGLTIALVGLALGIAGALTLTRLLSAMLFNVTTTDTTAFVAAPLVLGAVALFACWIPALRATRVDPARVLKQE